MAGYRFHVTCPSDGTPLQHVAAGNTDGQQTRTLTQCPECSVSYLVAVVLAATSPDSSQTPDEYAARQRGHLAMIAKRATSHKRKIEA